MLPKESAAASRLIVASLKQIVFSDSASTLAKVKLAAENRWKIVFKFPIEDTHLKDFTVALLSGRNQRSPTEHEYQFYHQSSLKGGVVSPHSEERRRLDPIEVFKALERKLDKDGGSLKGVGDVLGEGRAIFAKGVFKILEEQCTEEEKKE